MFILKIKKIIESNLTHTLLLFIAYIILIYILIIYSTPYSQEELTTIKDFISIIKDIVLSLTPFLTLTINSKNEKIRYDHEIELKKINYNYDLQKQLFLEKQNAFLEYVTSVEELLCCYSSENFKTYKKKYYELTKFRNDDFLNFPESNIDYYLSEKDAFSEKNIEETRVVCRNWLVHLSKSFFKSTND